MALGPAIEVSRLIKIYEGADIPAVNGITFNVPAGSIFGLLGPNGAGKTTTLSIIYGLIKPSSGQVAIHGRNIQNHRDEIKKIIGVVPQDIALYPSLTAYENLRYIGNMYGLSGKALKTRIMDCLEVFGLGDKRNSRLETFSGGMKRRINLLAGVLHQPQVLFLDEPTVGVDVQSRMVITRYLRELNNNGATIIYTSHLMEEAENLCTEIAIIDHGHLVSSGTPAALLSAHQAASLEDVFLKITGHKLRD